MALTDPKRRAWQLPPRCSCDLLREKSRGGATLPRICSLRKRLTTITSTCINRSPLIILHCSTFVSSSAEGDSRNDGHRHRMAEIALPHYAANEIPSPTVSQHLICLYECVRPRVIISYLILFPASLSGLSQTRNLISVVKSEAM